MPLLTLALLASACTGLASPRGWASPVLVVSDDPEQEDLLLVPHRDELFALGTAELSPLWAFPQANVDDGVDVDALYGTPAVMGETVFVPGYDGLLYAVGIAGDERGTVRPGWPFETDGHLVGGVTLSEDTVYFGSSDGNVYALDAETGLERWPLPFETGEAVWSTPTLSGDTLYVTSLDGHLYALDAKTGIERWSFPTGAGIASSPVVDEDAGRVYIAGFDSQLRAIDLDSHEQIWSLKADNWFWTRPLLADGVIYAGSLGSKVYAADTATGDLVWPQPFETESQIRSTPVIAGGQLIIIDQDGNVHGIDLENGTASATTPPIIDSDVVVDPVVLVSDDTADGEPVEEVLFTTTGGELIRMNATTLQVVDRRRLAGG